LNQESLAMATPHASPLPQGVPNEAAQNQQYLTFFLGEDVFALDIRTIQEIVQLGAMTPVPLMPECVRGVINLRGSVLPVLDIKARLGAGQTVASKKTCIVIYHALVNGDPTELGLLVDAVSEVVDIEAQQIEMPPTFGAAVGREFIRGLAKVKQVFVILLETDRLLDIDQIASSRS
jgi:purine-binding chemotaxis protein CheW